MAVVIDEPLDKVNVFELDVNEYATADTVKLGDVPATVTLLPAETVVAAVAGNVTVLPAVIESVFPLMLND